MKSGQSLSLSGYPTDCARVIRWSDRSCMAFASFALSMLWNTTAARFSEAQNRYTFWAMNPELAKASQFIEKFGALWAMTASVYNDHLPFCVAGGFADIDGFGRVIVNGQRLKLGARVKF